jgi:steroid delta-isomerase-like uncharacterized protein
MRPRDLFASIGLLLIAAACGPAPDAQVEGNKDLVRQFTEATNVADWELLAGIVAENFARHSQATAGPPVTSRDQFVQLQESFLVSFPDQRVTILQLVAEDDRVAMLATYSGTHTGPMGDIPPTGLPVESPFLAIFRVESGQIAELWVEWDNLSVMSQLGLFPPPPPTPTES